MDDPERFARITVPEEVRISSQPWLDLDPGRDTTGFSAGDVTQFQSLEDKQAYFRQPLFGTRFSTANYLQPEREFHQVTFLKCEVPENGRVLAMAEALEPTGIAAVGRSVIPRSAELVPLEMRPFVKARGGENRRWPILREMASAFRDGEFDAVVGSQMHHCDDYVAEFQGLARIVKPGGKLVLVDYGPSVTTFELAAQDPLLSWLLRTFVTWAGARRVGADRAYEYQKAIWLSAPVDEMAAAARKVVKDVNVWNYKGMAIIDGVCARP